jgi:hypothetical protein
VSVKEAPARIGDDHPLLTLLAESGEQVCQEQKKEAPWGDSRLASDTGCQGVLKLGERLCLPTMAVISLKLPDALDAQLAEQV